MIIKDFYIPGIGPNGLQVSGELDLNVILERIPPESRDEIFFKQAPTLEVLILPKSGGAEAQVKLDVQFKQLCGRCAELKERNLNFNLKFEAKRHSHDHKDSEVDDEGIVFYNGDHLDIENYLLDSLFLKIEPFFSPELDKQGKCKLCLKNFTVKEEKTSGNKLADALKKAGIS